MEEHDSQQRKYSISRDNSYKNQDSNINDGTL